MKILRAVGALLALLLAAALIVGPGIVERRYNRVLGSAPVVSGAAKALHERLVVADLHADSLLWQRDIVRLSGRGHLDVPRLITANVALQVFSVVNKAPRGLNMAANSGDSDLLLPLSILQFQSPGTWFSPKERALYQARKLERAALFSGYALSVIHSREDLVKYLQLRQRNPHITAGLLALEGGDAFEGDLGNVEALYQAGFRMVSITHFTDTALGGSATGARRGGLTALGRQSVVRMESRGIILDLAHASPEVVDDVLRVAKKPLVVSHTGLSATCASRRNLTDSQVRKIAGRGGLIGVAYFPAAVCGSGLPDIIRTLRHAITVAGADHVALGSDFDGTTAMPFDVTGLPAITAGLLRAGYTEETIAKVMGGNTIEFLRANLPAQ